MNLTNDLYNEGHPVREEEVLLNRLALSLLGDDEDVLAETLLLGIDVDDDNDYVAHQTQLLSLGSRLEAPAFGSMGRGLDDCLSLEKALQQQVEQVSMLDSLKSESFHGTTNMKPNSGPDKAPKDSDSSLEEPSSGSIGRGLDDGVRLEKTLQQQVEKVSMLDSLKTDESNGKTSSDPDPLPASPEEASERILRREDQEEHQQRPVGISGLEGPEAVAEQLSLATTIQPDEPNISGSNHWCHEDSLSERDPSLHLLPSYLNHSSASMSTLELGGAGSSSSLRSILRDDSTRSFYSGSVSSRSLSERSITFSPFVVVLESILPDSSDDEEEDDEEDELWIGTNKDDSAADILSPLAGSIESASGYVNEADSESVVDSFIGHVDGAEAVHPEQDEQGTRKQAQEQSSRCKAKVIELTKDAVNEKLLDPTSLDPPSQTKPPFLSKLGLVDVTGHTITLDQDEATSDSSDGDDSMTVLPGRMKKESFSEVSWKGTREKRQHSQHPKEIILHPKKSATDHLRDAAKNEDLRTIMEASQEGQQHSVKSNEVPEATHKNERTATLATAWEEPQVATNRGCFGCLLRVITALAPEARSAP